MLTIFLIFHSILLVDFSFCTFNMRANPQPFKIVRLVYTVYLVF